MGTFFSSDRVYPASRNCWTVPWNLTTHRPLNGYIYSIYSDYPVVTQEDKSWEVKSWTPSIHLHEVNMNYVTPHRILEVILDSHPIIFIFICFIFMHKHFTSFLHEIPTILQGTLKIWQRILAVLTQVTSVMGSGFNIVLLGLGFEKVSQNTMRPLLIGSQKRTFHVLYESPFLSGYSLYCPYSILWKLLNHSGWDSILAIRQSEFPWTTRLPY